MAYLITDFAIWPAVILEVFFAAIPAVRFGIQVSGNINDIITLLNCLLGRFLGKQGVLKYIPCT